MPPRSEILNAARVRQLVELEELWRIILPVGKSEAWFDAHARRQDPESKDILVILTLAIGAELHALTEAVPNGQDIFAPLESRPW